MTCESVREKIHDFLDQQLSAREEIALRHHLERCVPCRHFCEDFRWIQEALGLESPLKSASEQQLWQRIQARVPRGFAPWLGESLREILTFWRDSDRRVLWSRLVALPVTCGFFLLILLDLSPFAIHEITYPVLTRLRSPSSRFERLVITPTPVHQQEGSLNGLRSTVWRIPYEDSLSLVAKITPEGYAQINDVLEYPKSRELLEAVDLTLRRTQFESTSHLSKPFVIYSFQKINVYGSQKGM